MPYENIFTSGKPVISPDTGTQVVNYIRNSLHALRDAALYGGMKGFDYSVSGGTEDKPATIYYKNGDVWIRLAMTWGSSGGSNNKPTVIVISYSENAGADWVTVGTKTYTYTSGGYVSTVVWS